MKTLLRSFFPWALALLVVGAAPAPVNALMPDPVLSSYFVAPSSDAVMAKVAALFEVHERRANGFEVIVPAARRAELLALVPNAKLIQADIGIEIQRADLRGYHDFASVQAELQKLVSDHSDLAHFDTYGKSQEGRDLYVLTLTGKTSAAKTEVLVTSSTHGNELITVEVLFGLINRLVSGYGRDARLTEILDTHKIFFVPVVNPDGYIRKSRYANGVDPNREYPWPEEPERNPNAAIKAEIAFFDSHNIKATMDYHSAAGMVMYPWSYTNEQLPSADFERFDSVARKMAATNGYQYGQIPKLLYIAKGGSADYYYWKNKALAMATEIADSNTPPVSQIPHYVDQNAEALWIFLESVR